MKIGRETDGKEGGGKKKRDEKTWEMKCEKTHLVFLSTQNKKSFIMRQMRRYAMNVNQPNK